MVAVCRCCATTRSPHHRRSTQETALGIQRNDASPSILVTAAASGIGLATARHFAAQGRCVGGLGLDATALPRLAAELGSAQALCRPVHVTDRAALADASPPSARPAAVRWTCGSTTPASLADAGPPPASRAARGRNGSCQAKTADSRNICRSQVPSIVSVAALGLCSAHHMPGVLH
jgi:hypothetical protein